MLEQQDANRPEPASGAPQTGTEPSADEIRSAEPPGVPATVGTRVRPWLGLIGLVGAVAVGVLAAAFVFGGDSGESDAAAVAAADPGAALAAEAAWSPPSGGSETSRQGPGHRRFGGPDGRTITITAIDGAKLALETSNGWTRTIDAAGATVTKDGETVPLTELRVGDRIVFREERQADGTYEITEIRVVLPRVGGTVASIVGSTVTVTGRDGESQQVLLTGATEYFVGDTPATRDAVVTGARIVARGTLGTDGALTATSVVVMPAVALGTVEEKTADSITLAGRDDTTVIVRVTADTAYFVPGVESPTLADVEEGALVVAVGTSNPDGSLTAAKVGAWAPGTDGWLPGWRRGSDEGGPPFDLRPPWGPSRDRGWDRGWGRGGLPGWGDLWWPGSGPGTDAEPDASPLPSGEGTSS